MVVPDTGSVWLLGTSIGGVGKRLSHLIEVKDDTVADDYRSRFEKVWDEAAVVEVVEPEPEDELEGHEADLTIAEESTAHPEDQDPDEPAASAPEDGAA
jgi:hypothetical protein